MKNLVKYVVGKPFPRKHTIMDVDDVSAHQKSLNAPRTTDDC